MEVDSVVMPELGLLEKKKSKQVGVKLTWRTTAVQGTCNSAV